MPPAACAVFPPLQGVFPQEEVLHVRAAVARLVEELATAGQAHSGWALAERLVPRLVDGSFLAECSAAALPANG